MLHIIPLPDNYDAVFVASTFLSFVYKYHGLPEKIISDRDSVFMSIFWKSLFKTLGVKISPSTAYHPQTDGQTEIVNRKLEEMIRGFVNYDRDNWDMHLTEFEVAYNSSVHGATSFTPFYLNYGIHPKILPAELIVPEDIPSVKDFLARMKNSMQQAHASICTKNEQMARYANKKRIDHPFKIGDKVWLSTKNLKLESGATTRKLHPKFIGPFQIVKQVTPVTFGLELPQSMLSKGIHDSFHVSLLQPYKHDRFDRDPDPPPPIKLEDETLEYEVEKILDRKRRRNKFYYLVKWRGYADHENTWEPVENLTNAQEALGDYLATKRRSV